MDGQFRSLIARESRPITMNAIQKMRKNGLFRNLGDEATSNRISIRLNPRCETNDQEKVAAVLIPGIQGVAANEWYTFGANLATPTYLITLMKSKEATSIATIAESILGAVVDCFAKQKQFYIVGYSFGAIVAIQLAQMLELAGKRGRVLLIDGSPAYLKRNFASMMTSTGTTEEHVEDVLIMLLFFNMCTSDQTYDFIDQLQNCDKWSKKIDLLLRNLPETVKSAYSVPYLRNIFTAMSNRLKIVSNANADDATQIVKVKSPVTLVRPTQASIADIPNDYDLSKYAEQTVDVLYVKGNYLKMLSSDEVTQIIDKLAPAE